MEKKQAPLLKEAVEIYLDYLKEMGKKPGTITSYGKDFDLAIELFGEDKKIDSIAVCNIGKFFKSDQMNKLKNGNDKAEPTIKQTKRAVRMMFTWMKDSGMINALPIPKNEIPGNTGKVESTEEVANEAK